MTRSSSQQSGGRRSGQCPGAYRWLLHLLPGEFRGRHGAAMQETFTLLYERTGEAGALALVRMWTHETYDLLATAVILRVRRRHSGVSASAPSSVGTLAVLRDDLQLAFKSTTRHRGFFLLAALTLALGVGATTAMYSVLKAVVLDPLPYPTSARMVTLHRTMGTTNASVMLSLQPEQAEVVSEQHGIFDGVESVSDGSSTITDFGEAERISTVKVSLGLPALMGVRPVLGRTFSREEVAGDGAHVLLLSYSMWRSRFGGSRDVLGGILHVDGEPWTIIGVMPPEAVRPHGNPQPAALWLPLPETEPFRIPIARLAQGVTLEAASARVDAVVSASSQSRWGGTAMPVIRPGPLQEYLRVLTVAVVILLLVACMNVSNLLLQRGAGRARESAVRAALGATRVRLLRQHLFESVVLSVAGGGLGALLAYIGLRAMLVMRPDQLEALDRVRIDGGVLLFCIALSTTAGVLFSIVPALRNSRLNAVGALGRAGRESSGGPARFRWSLVTAEVALSFALLIGAALVATSLRELATRDPGFRADGLIAAGIRLPAWRYGTSEARSAAFEAMLADVRRMPGVQSAALANGVPPNLVGARIGRIQVEGRPMDADRTLFHSALITPEFLGTLGEPLVTGRGFNRTDATSDQNPVILSEAAAHRLFGSGAAVGRRFVFEGGDPYTVIGVVRDIRATGLADDNAPPLTYWPLQTVSSSMSILVRAERVDAELMLAIRDMVRRAEPDAITNINTVRELLGESLSRERFTTSLLSTFSILALLLAAVGLYGVLAHAVASRTREIGVRMALGADAQRILRLVVAPGLAATLAGLILGAGAAAGGLRILKSEVFGLAEHQPAAYVGAAVLLVAVAVAAMIVPATRAARLDPVRAIRTE